MNDYPYQVLSIMIVNRVKEVVQLPFENIFLILTVSLLSEPK